MSHSDLTNQPGTLSAALESVREANEAFDRLTAECLGDSRPAVGSAASLDAALERIAQDEFWENHPTIKWHDPVEDQNSDLPKGMARRV